MNKNRTDFNQPKSHFMATQAELSLPPIDF